MAFSAICPYLCARVCLTNRIRGRAGPGDGGDLGYPVLLPQSTTTVASAGLACGNLLHLQARLQAFYFITFSREVL